MYTPRHFRMSDTAECHDLIRQHPFGVLVSGSADEAPSASHLPFHLEPDEGPMGTLYMHLARANPQAATLDGRPVRCVFSGAHAYVSPTWYETAPAVPTWNYLAVHCIGRAERVDDKSAMESQMAALGHDYEAESGWRFDALPQKYRDGMIKGIVGFRVPIDELFGKAKLSQNKSEADIARSIEGLVRSDRPGDHDLATHMKNPPRSSDAEGS
ncbi:MAG: FMN-binding negative transcriptional regulator [Minwuia sp.]|uniref:FMN-binding negative transcriptional regulator n=1 Tax=Minwuia sp. TaxID=2493630 RepID=UPI003A83ECA1